MNKIEEIFKSWNIAFNPNDQQAELASKRIEICNTCEFKVTNLGVNRCSVCGCALKGKVFSPIQGACPKGKWDKVDGCDTENSLSLENLAREVDKLSEEVDISQNTIFNTPKVLSSVDPRVHVPQDRKIFVQIASYRDKQLIHTLDDLFANAHHPDLLKVCIAWQHSTEDEWDNLDKYKTDPRVIIIDIPHTESKGACWARNLIQQKYSGEDYTLQLDSHHRFTYGWDTELILMYTNLRRSGVQKPLITTYIPSFNPDNDPHERLNELWKMDFNRFTPEGYIFVYPSLVHGWESLTEPIPSRFYSAHFAFTTGQFCIEVPHDPHMYFHGEEPSLASRAYTHGYDLYHPHKIVAWHYYIRDGSKKQWDDDKDWDKKNALSHRRFRVLHKMEDDTNGELVEMDKYGFGNVRTLEQYEQYAGFRYRDRKVQQYTLDFNYPPNPTYSTLEEYENSLLSKFKHCIDIHNSHFTYSDYDVWVISFELDDGTVVYRQDADEQEIQNMLIESQKDDWVRIWREFIGQYPDKWVVWPHSRSAGWVERFETSLHNG